MSRWAYVEFAALMGVLAVCAITAAYPTSGPKPDPPPRVWVSSAYQPPQRCPAVQNAIGRYRKAYARSRQIMGLPGAVPRQWYPCDAARRRALEWRDKAETARRHTDAWVTWNYSWWLWMPRGSKAYRVASCETGYGRDPNWSHDSGTYVSAFGIYRPAYADDAHRIGNLSWDETIREHGRIPTPREQYDAMLSHQAAHGGWSGWGCRGA